MHGSCVAGAAGAATLQGKSRGRWGQTARKAIGKKGSQGNKEKLDVWYIFPKARWTPRPPSSHCCQASPQQLFTPLCSLYKPFVARRWGTRPETVHPPASSKHMVLITLVFLGTAALCAQGSLSQYVVEKVLVWVCIEAQKPWRTWMHLAQRVLPRSCWAQRRDFILPSAILAQSLAHHIYCQHRYKRRLRLFKSRQRNPCTHTHNTRTHTPGWCWRWQCPQRRRPRSRWGPRTAAQSQRPWWRQTGRTRRTATGGSASSQRCQDHGIAEDASKNCYTEYQARDEQI